MTTALPHRRNLEVVAVLALALACAVVVAPRAGAKATNPSEVDVVGAETISWSCIRLDNRDVEFLRSQVPLGTPVKIVR
jgi:hypothetical protein